METEPGTSARVVITCTIAEYQAIIDALLRYEWELETHAKQQQEENVRAQYLKRVTFIRELRWLIEK